MRACRHECSQSRVWEKSKAWVCIWARCENNLTTWNIQRSPVQKPTSLPMGEELHAQVGWLPAVVVITLRTSLLEVLQMPVLKSAVVVAYPFLTQSSFLCLWMLFWVQIAEPILIILKGKGVPCRINVWKIHIHDCIITSCLVFWLLSIQYSLQEINNFTKQLLHPPALKNNIAVVNHGLLFLIGVIPLKLAIL